MAVTPKGLLKLGLVAAGIASSGPAINEAKFIVTHADQIAKEGAGSVVVHAKQLAVAALPPVGLIVVAPKGVDAAVAFANKGTPLVNRVANAKLMKI